MTQQPDETLELDMSQLPDQPADPATPQDPDVVEGEPGWEGSDDAPDGDAK